CGGSGLLGRALVAALCGSGATLVVASRTPRVIAPAGEQNAGTVEAEPVDIESEASLHQLRDRVLQKHGRVDGLVFNAVSRPMRGLGDDLAAWQASMATNATGFFATVRTFGDVMAARGSGSIVNIASHMGMVGMHPALYDGPAAYPSPDYFFHKGGMINLTRYLASAYGGRGVRVNVVSPGGIFNPERPQPDAFLQKYGAMTMLGRMARASEVGGAAVFLLSDASTYVTGANLPVDGGYSAK
ncbi:MAG: SDR family oxidoreductase, partial [Verrucomicrobia bacterium]|nr:SDR family oxidoreductase [Verrucomicrobiota bacterium]